MKNRGVLSCILLSCVFAITLFLFALPLRSQSAPQFRPLTQERFAEFTWFRLDNVVHGTQGADARKGNALYTGPDRSLYVARARGVFAINPQRTAYQYYWLPDDLKGGTIVSIYVSRTALWLGLSNGKVARCMLNTNSWRVYDIHNNAPIRLAVAEGSILAFETRTGGQIWFFNERAGAFQPYFDLPEELEVTPITPLRSHGRSWYMGSDMGLFRIGRPGTGNLFWELCGTREGLAKTILHDFIEVQTPGPGLLLATSRPQRPRLPRNIRPTSYGYFAYNYLQGRWDRIREPLPSKLEQFLEMNAANTNTPSNGLWYYESGKDIAHQVRGAEGDFYRLAAVSPEISLAASMHGVFVVGMYQGSYRALRILELPEIRIDDIAGDAQNVYILAGRSVFVLPKNRFDAQIFERALTRERAPAETAAANGANAQGNGGANDQANGGANGQGSGEANGAAGDVPADTADTITTDAPLSPQREDAGQAGQAPIRDTAGYSEEMRFIRQIEQYLRQQNR
jgi:hypothetical protein